MISKNSSHSKTFKSCILAIALIFPLSGFAQANKKHKESTNRVGVDFKQRHSRTTHNQDLFADGIKIKRDLSLIDKVQESRILDLDEIPADEIYGGIWTNNQVNAYRSLETAPDTFRIDLTNFTMPTMGHTTSNFGKRRYRMHYGVDLKVQVGDTIYAAFDGKVRMTQYERRGYGYYVVLRHQNGLETVYGHLSGFLVKEDDVVKTGDPIALGGNTGRSTGSHLHFELRYAGRPINPNDIVDFENKVCHRDYYTVTPRTFNYAGSNSSILANSKNYTPTKNGKSNKYVSGKVNYHRVTNGDSLYKIAKRYGTTVRNICRLNNVSERTTLRLGQTLRIS